MALGLSSLVGVLGSIVCPYVTNFTKEKLEVNPMVSVGVIVFASAVFGMVLLAQ